MASYSPMYWLAHRHARDPSLRPDLNVGGILGVPRPRRPWYWTEDFLPFTGDDCSEDADGAVTPYELCETCIPIRDYVQKLDLESMRDTRRATLAHAPTGQVLEDSALAGCHLCTLFWQLAIRDAYQSRRYIDTVPRGAGWMDYAAQIRRLTDLHISIGTWKQESRVNKSIGMLIHAGSHWDDEKAPFLVKLDRAPAHTCSWHERLIYTRTTASSGAKAWLNQQLQRCESDQHSCAPARPEAGAFLPTRVLDVGVDAQSPVRLLLPSHETLHRRYTALSYCWGSLPNLTLTTATLDDFCNEIPLHLLPKTLRDAIHVTRWVGVRYLWIDALCIIQDSPADWKQEAATMADVYRHSYLTIAALVSNDSHGGLFAQRHPLEHQPCKLFDEPDGTAVFAFPHELDRDRVGVKFAHSPLLHRAWTVQELLLSPRTVYFGDVLVWECFESMDIDVLHCRSQELLPDQSATFIRGQFSVKQFHSQLAALKRSSTAAPLSQTTQIERMVGASSIPREATLLAQLAGIWEYIVPKYTSCALTYPTDRFVALRGITTFLQAQTGFSIFAGLWEPLLLQQLLWTCGWYPPSSATRRWKAPTWSWFSVDASIEFDTSWRECTLEESYQDSHWFSRLLGVDMHEDTLADGRDPSIAGRVRLSAPFFPMTLAAETGVSNSSSGFWPTGFEADTYYHLTLDLIPPSSGACFYLPLLHIRRDGTTNNCHGLIVVPSPSVPHAFERLGYCRAQIYRKEAIALLEGQEREIVLV